jgi:hypothetical protein
MRKRSAESAEHAKRRNYYFFFCGCRPLLWTIGVKRRRSSPFLRFCASAVSAVGRHKPVAVAREVRNGFPLSALLRFCGFCGSF